MQLRLVVHVNTLVSRGQTLFRAGRYQLEVINAKEFRVARPLFLCGGGKSGLATRD